MFDEEDYEDILPTTNKEDRIIRINPEMSCPICPPNRGENRHQGSYKRAKREPGQHERAKNRNASRKFKSEQRKIDYGEQEETP